MGVCVSVCEFKIKGGQRFGFRSVVFIRTELGIYVILKSHVTVKFGRIVIEHDCNKRNQFELFTLSQKGSKVYVDTLVQFYTELVQKTL